MGLYQLELSRPEGLDQDSNLDLPFERAAPVLLRTGANPRRSVAQPYQASRMGGHAQAAPRCADEHRSGAPKRCARTPLAAGEVSAYRHV